MAKPAPATFSATDAAIYLGLSRKTLYRLRERGHLAPDVHYPGDVPSKPIPRYSKASLDRYIESCTVPSAA